MSNSINTKLQSSIVHSRFAKNTSHICSKFTKIWGSGFGKNFSYAFCFLSFVLHAFFMRYDEDRFWSDNMLGFGFFKVARNRTATLSSTLEGHISSNAVDGNTYCDKENTIAASANSFRPHLLIQLGVTYNVEKVVIHSRSTAHGM